MNEWDGKGLKYSAPEVELLSQRIGTLHLDVNDIKTTLKELTSAITKLALIEERLANATAAQERSFKAIQKIEERVDALEKSQVIDDSQAKWLERTGVAIIGALAAYVWEKLKGG